MSDEQKTEETERKGGEGLRACETCRYIDNMESGMNEPCLTCQRVGNYYLWSEDVPTRAADDEGEDYKIHALERMRVELSDAHVLNAYQAAEIGRLKAEINAAKILLDAQTVALGSLQGRIKENQETFAEMINERDAKAKDQAAEIKRLTVENKRINDLCQSANAELLDERLKDSPTNDRRE